jgi:aminopeptidase-like protein
VLHRRELESGEVNAVAVHGSRAAAPAMPGPAEAGEAMFSLARALFPLNRSLTGNGVRESLRLLSEWADLEITEVPSGTEVYDWRVPPEWNVREAWIEDAEGRRLVDLEDSSLHVVGYSEPIRSRLRGAELQPHLHSLPAHPDWIPYRTSYHDRTWGFCLSDNVRSRIDEQSMYEVLIDSEFDDAGSLTLGECVVPGLSEDEILVSTYICHPSLANDNVAGIVVASALARWLPRTRLRHTVRILFSPSGVGTLAWLQRNERHVERIRAGLVIACAGDRGPLSYKRSRRCDTVVDRAAVHVLSGRRGATVREFVPWGTDERQFCSPGFDLPVGTLTRTPNGEYAEYHTSADNLDLIGAEHLADTLSALTDIVDLIDADLRLIRTEPRGEPQLSRHSIEGTMSRELLGGRDESKEALFWLLNLADGGHTLFDVVERSGLPLAVISETADALLAADLVREAPQEER